MFQQGNLQIFVEKKSDRERDIVVDVNGRDAPEVFNKDCICSGELEYLSGSCMSLKDIFLNAKCI